MIDRNVKAILKKRGGSILALIALITYIIMLFTHLYFVTSILLLGLIIVLPLILIAILKKDRKLILKRTKASCWALGFLILILFPAFWLIPQQMYVRINRQETLITPNEPAVEDFANKFIASSFFTGWSGKTFTEKAKAVSKFTTDEIKWILDYQTYGMSGHVATPKQCIELGMDDCQGQAVTMASLLLNSKLNNTFPYVWVVETPFHWYVLVRDPAKGKLEEGWETKVEEYQETGEILPLNRDGQGSMPEWRLEEVVLIFNDKETLYPQSPIGAILTGWTAKGFSYDDLFPIFLTFGVIFLVLLILLFAMPFALWSYYMSSYSDFKRREYRENKGKVLAKRMLVLGPLLFSAFFLWFLLLTIRSDYALILSITVIAIISILASEQKFWELLRM
jgi:hypothetical protein